MHREWVYRRRETDRDETKRERPVRPNGSLGIETHQAPSVWLTVCSFLPVVSLSVRNGPGATRGV